jgi:hypothetical protein
MKAEVRIIITIASLSIVFALFKRIKMHANEFSSAVTKARELSKWISQNIDGLPMVPERRSRLAAGCLHLAFDHHDAIILLIEHEIYGSAFALLRLIFESCIRGLWLHHCASEADLDQFEKDKLERSFGLFISDLEKLDDYSAGVLSQTKKDHWKQLCSFTHSGFQHVQRRNTQNCIEANYSETELVDALNFACAIAIMSTLGFAIIAGNKDLERKSFEKSKLFSEESAASGHCTIFQQ